MVQSGTGKQIGGCKKEQRKPVFSVVLEERSSDFELDTCEHEQISPLEPNQLSYLKK